ncbi:MAG: adenylosuccinate lyase [Chlamydiae bacterium]|nr:adenylosuccinate lyase [Chlamydiota bacterium]MBI3277925.1 adenylosuccinate lyase [Chlamydiota bacterium]
MIERYSTPEMVNHWSEEKKLALWLKIELLALESMVKLGKVPKSDFEKIKKGAHFHLKRVSEIEKSVEHDVIAFLTNLSENIGSSARFIHFGLTSSDVLDTSLAVLMVDAMDILIKDFDVLVQVMKEKAVQYKHTLMMGRSHGVHAEPTTLGLKLALFLDELYRNRERLTSAKKIIGFGKISGAVGTHAHVDLQVEEYVCKKLNLMPAPVSSQIIQRDRHAQYISALAIFGSSLEKFALEIRNLQRTEIQEIEEGFGKEQKGSSAMPHKRNPITCERICGLARVLRGYAVAAMENVALWHERDMTHSSVERIIIPDATTLIHTMIRLTVRVFQNMVVYPQNMMRNIGLTQGAVFSQRLLLELIQKGKTREEAYRIVQRVSLKAWDEKKNLKESLLGDKEFLKLIDSKRIEACFDLKYHLKHVDDVFKRLGL